MVLADTVSKLDMFVWILNCVSRSGIWSLFTLKASNLVKWLWWSQFVDCFKFKTCPSSLHNFGMAYWPVTMPPIKKSHSFKNSKSGKQAFSVKFFKMVDYCIIQEICRMFSSRGKGALWRGYGVWGIKNIFYLHISYYSLLVITISPLSFIDGQWSWL